MVAAVLAGSALVVAGGAVVLLGLDRCRPADGALGARLLRSDVLLARPAGAEQTRAGSLCDGDDAWVVAERAYAFDGTDADVVSTYDRAAHADGWRLVATAPDGSRCYERSLDGRVARLDVLPSAATGAPRGYSVTVLASRHDDRPCD